MFKYLTVVLLASFATFTSACNTIAPALSPGTGSSTSPTSVPTAFPTTFPSSLIIPSATPMPLPTAILASSSSVPATGIGFEDLFEKPSNLGIHWTIVDDPASIEGPSTWSIQNGKLLQSSNIYATDDKFTFYEGTRLITQMGPWFNSRISVKINPTDNDGIGVLFRYKNSDNYYRFFSVQDSLNGGPFARLEVKQNGVFRTLAQDKLSLQDASLPVSLLVTVNGPQITVVLNGQQRLQVNDATFNQGKAGLMTFACSAEFTEFRVEVLP